MLGDAATPGGVDTEVAAPTLAKHVPFEMKFCAMMKRTLNPDSQTGKKKDRMSDTDLLTLREYHQVGGVISIDMVASMYQYQTADCVCKWVRQKISGFNFPPHKQIQIKYDQYSLAMKNGPKGTVLLRQNHG